MVYFIVLSLNGDSDSRPLRL